MRKPLPTMSLPLSAAKTLTGALLGGLIGFAGCSAQPVYLPSHDLDRPTDMTFSCLELDQAADPATPVVLGAQPMDVCHPPGQKDPLFGGPVAGSDGISRSFKTYAFIANSDRGDVSVVDMSYCRSNDDACKQHALPPGAALVDLDPNTIGYGSAPVGEFPEAIDASQDGCRLVTANRGSCDLTLIDPAAMLTPRLTGGALPPYARTFMVRTGGGQPLAVAPGEIAFVPQQTNISGPGRGPGQLCTTGVMPPPATGGTLAAPVGTPQATPDQRASWRAVVTFPSCDLVALVDLQTETILDSYRVRPGKNANGDSTDVTLFHTGADPSCPRTDCGPGAGAQADAGTTVTEPVASPDAGASSEDGGVPGGDGGGDAAVPVVSLDDSALALQVRPMAIRPEGTRVYFGATNWSAVGALDIEGDTLAVPSMGAITPLYATTGVMRLRLSVDRYAYVNGHLPKTDSGDPNDPTKPELGRFVARTDDANLQYLYAIARDASVRTIDVSRPDPKECDIGIDPTAVSETDLRRKCFPFGASDNPPRLPQVPYLPGLRFPSAPQDVAFAYYWTNPSVNLSDQAVNEQILNGAYAFVLTSGGGLFVINIDPEPRQTERVYYTQSGDPAQAPFYDTEFPPADPANPAPVHTTLPVGGLRRESPLPLPNTQRDPNVITYVSGLLTSVGPARVETANPITTSNGPLLALFDATTTRENSLIVPFLSNGTLIAPTTKVPTYVYFPNPVTVLPQGWIIAWEPDITGTRNAGDIDRVHHLDSNSPRADLAFALTDNGALFCTNGIFPGDTVTLTGCTADANCGPGRVCLRSTEAPTSASGYPINGLCVRSTKVNDADVRSRCAPLLRSFRRYEILPTASDFDPAFKDQNTPQSTLVVIPKKAELPVFGPCGPNCSLTGPPGRADLAGFSCQDGVNEGRCLMTCDPADGGDTKCAGHRPGSVCVDFRASEGHFYCADGAPLSDGAGELDDTCGLDQLISYSVSAGRTFVVSGTSVGRLDAGGSSEVRVPAAAGAGGQGGDAGGMAGMGGAGGNGGSTGAAATTGTGLYQCAPDHSTPNVVARIPMNLPRCTSPKLTEFTAPSSLAPTDTPFVQPTPNAYKAIFTDSTVPSPNPCLVEYGPETVPLDGAAGASGSTGAGGAGGSAGGSPLGAAGPTYSAVFQNREVRFVLTNLETTIGDTVQIRFTVDGGSIGQQVAVAADSAIGLPARVVTGPVPALDQTIDPVVPAPMGALPTDLPRYLPSDLPFLFVLDQRTNATGRLATRGQILRVAPRISDTAPTPGYDSALTSNSYFPIQ